MVSQLWVLRRRLKRPKSFMLAFDSHGVLGLVEAEAGSFTHLFRIHLSCKPAVTPRPKLG